MDHLLIFSLKVITKNMKIVMTMFVRNEDDILRENIEYHLANGVDLFIITDHHSDDNTFKIIEEYAIKGKVFFRIERSDEHHQAKWVSTMAKVAFKDFGADWVINNDADEFWTVKSGNLKSYLESIDSRYWKIHVNRYNFHYRPFKGKFYDIMLFREINKKWTKCCHRAVEDINVDVGNHDAFSKSFSEKGLQVKISDEIEIFHFPIREKERYKKKIIDGMTSLWKSQDIPSGTFFHWKQALDYINSGRYEEYLNNFRLTPHNVNPMILSRQLMFDDKIQKFFNKI